MNNFRVNPIFNKNFAFFKKIMYNKNGASATEMRRFENYEKKISIFEKGDWGCFFCCVIWPFFKCPFCKSSHDV